MRTAHGTDYATLRALVASLETDARHCRKVAGEARFLGHLLSRDNHDRALSYLLLARAFASVARELGKGHRHPLGVIDANTQRRQRTMTDAKHVYEPSEAAPSPRGACVITGAPGENPDDCTTHAHEGPPVDWTHEEFLYAAASDAIAAATG